MPRKKEIKNLSIQELIEEKQKALSILSDLRQWAISTIKEIDSISSQLGTSNMNLVFNPTIKTMDPLFPTNTLVDPNLDDYKPINVVTESMQIKQITLD